MKEKKLLNVQNITVEFNQNKTPFNAVNNVSFDIYQGETFGLVGESGSGKTTTGKAIMGIDYLKSGNIFFEDRLIRGNISSLKKMTKEINNNLKEINLNKNILMKLVNDFLINYKKGTLNSHKLINKIDESLNENLKQLIKTITTLDTDKQTILTLRNDKELDKKAIDEYDSLINKIYDFVMFIKKTMNHIYELFNNVKDKPNEAELKQLVSDIKLFNRISNSLINDGKSLKELPNIDKKIKHSKVFGKLTKQEVKQDKKDIQMIFQDPGSSLNDRMNVEQIISEGLENYPELYKNDETVKAYMKHEKINDKSQVRNSDVKRFLVEQALTSVGMLPEHLNRYPHEFSGGQKQRIGIARALVMKPKFIIADEPISSLDVSIRAQVINLLNKFKKEYGLTYMFIAHDLTVVRFTADRIGVIYHGKLVELADSEELFKNPIHPYTKALLKAIPIPNPDKSTKVVAKYDEEKEHYDYLVDYPVWTEIKPGHYVYLNNRELKTVKKGK